MFWGSASPARSSGPCDTNERFLGLAQCLQTNHITRQPTNVFLIGKNRKEWVPVAAPGKYPRLLWGWTGKVSICKKFPRLILLLSVKTLVFRTINSNQCKFFIGTALPLLLVGHFLEEDIKTSTTSSRTNIEQMAKTIRFLAVETMKVAKSGYLGMPICMADVTTIVA